MTADQLLYPNPEATALVTLFDDDGMLVPVENLLSFVGELVGMFWRFSLQDSKL